MWWRDSDTGARSFARSGLTGGYGASNWRLFPIGTARPQNVRPVLARGVGFGDSVQGLGAWGQKGNCIIRRSADQIRLVIERSWDDSEPLNQPKRLQWRGLGDGKGVYSRQETEMAHAVCEKVSESKNGKYGCFPDGEGPRQNKENEWMRRVPSRVGWAEMARWASIPKTRLKTSDLPVPMPPPTFAHTPSTTVPNSSVRWGWECSKRPECRPAETCQKAVKRALQQISSSSLDVRTAQSSHFLVVHFSLQASLWCLLREKVSVWGDEHMEAKGVWNCKGSV